MNTLQPAALYWRHCGVQWMIRRAIFWANFSAEFRRP